LVIRPLTDWVFKFISWLIIGATLVFAWEKTRNPYLAGAALVASLLPGAFIYSFLQWLSKLERKPKAGAKQARKQLPQGRRRKLRGAAVIALSGIVWSGLTIATQIAVQQTASAMLEFKRQYDDGCVGYLCTACESHERRRTR
jgi:hypothetical protein